MRDHVDTSSSVDWSPSGDDVIGDQVANADAVAIGKSVEFSVTSSDGVNSIFSRDTGSFVSADTDPALNSIDSDGNAWAGMLAAPFAIGESSQGPSMAISSWSSALTPSLSVDDVRAGANFLLTQWSFAYGADASIPAATDSANIRTSAMTGGGFRRALRM